MRYIFLLILVALTACKTETDKKVDTSYPTAAAAIKDSQAIKTPDALLGKLFVDVQLNEVFPDGKTFVDCTAKFPPQDIVEKYESQKTSPDFNLEEFVLENFEVPVSISSDFKSDPDRTAVQHVNSLWPVLQRESDAYKEGSTLIPLPRPYIVPGGRFREVYYWDSYFTMLGLVESGEFGLIEDMLDNFAHLIKTVGHIPNGNRTYYVTRSQPPFFSQMVKLLAAHRGEEVYEKYKDALRKEYEFWMEGKNANQTPLKHCVSTPLGVMNRFYDLGNTPRQESYREDYTQVQTLGGGTKMYRDLRAGAESGWDFSSRWFADGASLATIETTDIIPIDLNALLYGLEEVLTRCFRDDPTYVAALKSSMEARKAFLNEYCWNEIDGVVC